MRKPALLLALATLLVVVNTTADPCPCVPLSHKWTVLPCDTWECVQVALSEANGDRNVFAMPSPSEEHRWVILRRQPAGAAIEDPESTFRIEQYTKMLDGSLRFDSIDTRQMPVLVTAYDKAVLVIYLREGFPRPRAVRH
jgi:hypothetical protein